MGRLGSYAALIALLAALAAPVSAQPKDKLAKHCTVPNDVAEAVIALPHAAKGVEREKTLKIIALGSSSTLGSGASGAAASWPAQLELELRKHLPEVNVTVVNKGQMRQSVPDMLARLQRDVIDERPSLVIWEAGTYEAVRGVEPDLFATGLLSGVDKLGSAKADVILMDMQYARNTARLINFQPYAETMATIASMRDIYLFPRYDIMRRWVENEQVTFEGQTPAEAVKTADLVYACLAKSLATIIAQAVKPR